ncbi:MAG: hypothetical protein OIN84_05305, partial [Candidatus Methanoperedens sp.]|nr:hypothetical protein [Candidatus Methanoperedens nitroreducens]MCX9077378.1 hypothetical protein [Candidatus Methanoperedens sp.]
MNKIKNKIIKLQKIGRIERVYVILILLFLSILISSAATLNMTVTSPSTNLAPNSGFETDPLVDYFTYGKGTFTWANDAAHTGSRSTKIVSIQ